MQVVALNNIEDIRMQVVALNNIEDILCWKEPEAANIVPLPILIDARWKDSFEDLKEKAGIDIIPQPPQIMATASIAQHIARDGNDSTSQHILFAGTDSKIVQYIADLYCRAHQRSLTVMQGVSEFAQWLKSIPSLRHLTIWGLAPNFDFQRVETLEKTVYSTKHTPAIGYMIAEDFSQLLWLAFKTTLFNRLAKVCLPDGLFIEEPFQLLPPNHNETLPISLSNYPKILSPCDMLILHLHGRSFEASISRAMDSAVTVCAQRERAITSQLGPRCSCGGSCFREAMYTNHNKIFIWELRSRVVFVDSCASWRSGNADVDHRATLTLRALDGWCTAYVGSRYEKQTDARVDYLALAAWRSGLSIGRIIRLLSPKRLQLFSLVGDAEQTRLNGVRKGFEKSTQNGDSVYVEGINHTLLTLDNIDSKKNYRVVSNGLVVGNATKLGQIDAEKFSFYIVENCNVENVNGVLLQPVESHRRINNPAIPSKETNRWTILRLLNKGEQDNPPKEPENLFRWLAHQTWVNYCERYWPGPIIRYDDPTKGPTWRAGSYYFKGFCACGLPTMTLISPVFVQPESHEECLNFTESICPQCYQVTFHFEGKGVPSLDWNAKPDSSICVGKDLVIKVRTPENEAPGSLWIAIAESEVNLSGVSNLPEPAPVVAFDEQVEFKLKGGLPRKGIHHVRAYYGDLENFTLAAISRMLHIV